MELHELDKDKKFIGKLNIKNPKKKGAYEI